MSIKDLYLDVCTSFICNCPKLKQPKGPLTGELMNALWHPVQWTSQYPTAETKDLTRITQLNLKISNLSVKEARHKRIHAVSFHLCVSRKCKLVYSDRKQIRVCLGMQGESGKGWKGEVTKSKEEILGGGWVSILIVVLHHEYIYLCIYDIYIYIYFYIWLSWWLRW